MTTPAYVSQADFDTYISDEIGSTEASLRATSLLAAERRVNEYCQRTFVVAGSASARTYVPSGTSILRVHDCTTLTAITVSGTTVDATTYQKEPVAVSWSGQTRPYEQVRLLNSCWWIVYPGQATISVTATWGWAAVPDDVVEVTKLIGRLNVLRRRMYVADDEYAKVLAALKDLRRVEAFGIA